MLQSVKIIDAAAELEVTPTYLYRLIRDGAIKARVCEIGGEVYIERFELDRFKAERKQAKT